MMPSKSYSKTGKVCRVTFRLPAEVEAESVALCGDFNEWDPESTPMKQLKDGSFSTTVSLTPGETYRYRFLLDNERWENDWEAEAYAPNELGSEDSIITV
jgi:1,4-alpha-glucan branching enzyme